MKTMTSQLILIVNNTNVKEDQRAYVEQPMNP
jgi:hypothetical protein